MRNIILVGALFIAAMQPASAENISQSLATVSVSRSDMAGGRASEQLQRRIEVAIEAVCGTSADTLEQFAALARCKKAARVDVNRQLAGIKESTRLAAQAR